MENKEKLNQNPEEAVTAVQEENPMVSTKEAIKVSNEETNVKATDAEGDKQEKEVLATEEVENTDELVVLKATDAEDVKTEKEVLAEKEVKSTIEAKKEDLVVSEENPDSKKKSEELDEEDEDEEAEVVTEETYANHSLEELTTEMEAIVESEEIIKAKNKISFIRLFFGKKITEFKKEAKEKFLKDGGVEEEYKPEHNPLQEKFNHAFGKYKSLKGKYRKEQEQMKVENLKKKDLLLEEMRGLISSNEKLKDTYDKFNEIQT
ncbi:MAG: DUF349 domain-containing protein, partial [Chlamydiia bacterium]|nr:DUF349 domain-containing protein [Chlamydiia bacterium]